MKQIILVLLASTLVGCGGVHQAKRNPVPQQPVQAPIPITPTVVGVTTPGVAQSSTVAAAPAATVIAAVPVAKPFAAGPIKNACMSSDRKSRSQDLCGCIQAVADDRLSVSQQRLAVSFYNDPHRAQEIRQSDSTSHRNFGMITKPMGKLLNEPADRSTGSGHMLTLWRIN